MRFTIHLDGGGLVRRTGKRSIGWIGKYCPRLSEDEVRHFGFEIPVDDRKCG